MGTEILKSFGVLQSELEQAKTSLKGVDENIKRLIGRDPSEIIPRPGVKRGLPNEDNNRGRQRVPVVNRNRNFNHENDEPPNKRRTTSVFKRLSERPVHYEDEMMQQPQKQLISKVIVTPREVPSRQEALAAQSTDEKSKARNRRMFGALLGTLQKFQQEETKLKSKEQKRAQVEKKIEEHEIREKAEIKKERQELFFNRKKKQAEIKMIELKMTRMREYAAWEERQKPRANFILTKAKPHICYLPRKLNDTTKTLLENCKNDVEKMIEKRRQEVFTELQHIEDRMKKNFEPKKPKEAAQGDEPHEDNDVDGELKDDELDGCDSHINDTTNEHLNATESGETELHDKVNDVDQTEKENNLESVNLENQTANEEPMEQEENSEVHSLEPHHVNNGETNLYQEQLPQEINTESQSCTFEEQGSAKGESD